MKTDKLSLIIYAVCIALIIWGVSDLLQVEKEWYDNGFALWRIIGGATIAFVLWWKNKRSRKNKGL